MTDDTPTVVHLAYGGVGGHHAVITALAAEHRRHGVRSVAVLVTPASDAQLNASDWDQLDQTVFITMRRRGDLPSMAGVTRAVVRARPSVVVAHTHRHLAAAWLGMLLIGRAPRLVLAEHQQVSLRTRMDELWSFIGVLLSRGLALLTPDYLERYRWRRLARLLRRRVAVIPNGVAAASTDAHERDSSRQVIGMASRLIPSKDLVTLIDAVAVLRDLPNTSDIELHIAGDGPERERLEQLVQQRGLNGAVRFLGRLDTGQMTAFYRSLSCYVQASFGETLSMAVLEAGSHALPVVASDVPGLNDLITHGETGLLVPPSDPTALADAIGRAVDQPDLGERLRDVVLANYSASVVAQQYLEFLAKLAPALRPCLNRGN